MSFFSKNVRFKNSTPSRGPNKKLYNKLDKNSFNKQSFESLLDDNIARESLLGYPSSELSEGDGPNYQEDSYEEISRIHPDDELKKVIEELLSHSKRVNATNIKVQVVHSNVTLTGQIHSQREMDELIPIVKLVHGVGEVKLDLQKIH